MKQKVFVSGLCLALALSLASCGGQQSGQEPQKPEQEVQQTEQVSTPPAVEPMEVKQEAEPSAAPTEPVVLNEVDTTGEVEDAGANEPAETMQLFNNCNETVYATGTVNIRASYTADSEKLGSLSVGQSVTRTGTSIAGTEAEGWSRVTLSDGTTAYINNNYLSTTKPVTQSVSSGTTQTQTSKPSSTSQPSASQPSSTSGSGGSAFSDVDPDEAARKAAFLANDAQFAEEHGMTSGTVDHDYTEEELQALANAIKTAP